MRTKSLKRRISNIVLLGILLAIVVGIYYNIYNSRAEDLVVVAAEVLDNYGYLENEEFELEAKLTENEMYEIEFPETFNNKKVNEIYSVFLKDISDTTETTAEQIEKVKQEAEEQAKTSIESTENTSQEEAEEPAEKAETPTEKVASSTEAEQNVENTLEKIETEENKIILSKEQIESKKIIIEASYDIAIIEKTEEGEIQKELLADKPQEERKAIELSENAKMYYNKVLKYENTKNGKTVELKGYLPEKAEIQIEELTQEQIAGIFENEEVTVAYDIKIIVPVEKEIEVIEYNEDGTIKYNEDGSVKYKTEIIIEYQEITPEDFGEKCEVLIQDSNIVENSKVVHINEKDTYEEVIVTKKEKESISFEAEKFSIYAVMPIATSSEIDSEDENATLGTNEDEPSGIAENENEQITYNNIEQPTIEINPKENTTWQKSHTATITILDTSSTGLEEGAKVQYGWSKSTITQPTTWTTLEITGYTAGAESASATITASGLTGIYYLWVKPVTVKDLEGNLATNTVKSRAFKFDNIAPSVKFEPSGNATWKQEHETTVTINEDKSVNSILTATTVTASDYGKYVTNYSPINGTNIGWRIFHADGDNIYLIADDYVETSYVPGTITADSQYSRGFSLENILDDYSGSGDIAENNPAKKWLKKYLLCDNGNNQNDNMKATAYLINTEKWKEFKDNNYSEYAIGGPTLELFVESYNETHPDKKILTQVVDSGAGYGYQMAWEENRDFGQYLYNVEDTLNELYIKVDKAKAYGTWLTSPAASYADSIMVVYDGMLINERYSTACGVRPIVALSPEAGLEKQSDGTYIITKNIETEDETVTGGAGIKKDTLKYVWRKASEGTPTKDQITETLVIEGTSEIIDSQTSKTIQIQRPISKDTESGNDWKLWIYVEDTSGNSNIVSSEAFWFDNTAPTLEITANTPNITNANTVTYTFKFNEDVTNFEAENITVANGTKGEFTQVSASEYTLEVATIENGEQSVNIAQGVVKDSAGNTSIGGSKTITIDKTLPTITLNPTQNTTLAQSHNVEVKISDKDTGLVANAQIQYAWSESNTEEPSSWTPVNLENAEGTKSESVTLTRSGVAGTNYLWIKPVTVEDLAGNSLTETITSGAFTFDIAGPTLEITADAESPTNASTIIYTFQFSEPVTGFEAEDIIVTNGTKGTFTSAEDGKTYTLEVTNNTSCEQTISVPAGICIDEAGNGNEVAGTSIIIDRTEPTLEITADKQSPTNADTITYTFKFSEEVTGFEVEDITVTNGIKGAFTQVSNSEYTLVLEVIANGTQKVSVATGKCYDLVGNDLKEETTFEIEIDKVSPTITLSPNQNKTWQKAHSATVTITDEQAGLAEGAKIQYGWSTKRTVEPSEYKELNITGYQVGKESASATITASGLTGTYYLWIKPVNVKDLVGNSATDTVKSRVFKFDNTAPSVKFEANGNSTWQQEHETTVTINEDESENAVLTATEISTSDYGGYVTNYSPINGANVGWRIFHTDGDNIYLIADDYVETSYVPGATTVDNSQYSRGFSLENILDNYSGSGAIAENNPAKKWLKKYLSYYSENENMKATAYLINTEKWKEFEDNNYSEYAIGGPTLELFVESYNETHPDKKILTQVVDSGAGYGYQMAWEESRDFGQYLYNVEDTLNELYIKVDTTKAYGTWLASPSSGNANSVMVVSNEMLIHEPIHTACGVRPIVALSPEAGLEKQSDGTYIITKNIETEDETVTGGAGIKKNTLKYVWRKASEGTPTKDQIAETLVIEGTTETLDEQTLKTIQVQRSISKDTGSGNDWVLWIYAEDTLGNSEIVKSGAFWLDNTAPEISFNPDGDTTTWRREDTTEVTVEDKEETAPETGGAGVKTSTIKYRWVQGTSTLTIENFANGEEKPYTTTDDVVKTITETISSTGGEGETLKTGDNWYLWIYAEDNAGNANVAKTANPFKLDNTKPTISVSKESAEVCKSVDITITAVDMGSGFANNSEQFIAYLSENNNNLVNQVEIGYTSGATIEDVGAGMTGWRYLFVRTVKDKVDLESEQGGNIVTASDGNKYHVYGPYIFDNTAPNVVYDPNGNGTWSTSHTTKVTITEEEYGGSAETEKQPIENGISASEITPEDYGGYVVNYVAENGANVGWRILHSDEENIYLIADDYIENEYIPSGKGGSTITKNGTYKVSFENVANDYVGLVDIAEDNPARKWLTQLNNTREDISKKATAYLVDYTLWSGFKYGQNVEYAIGAPTLELYVASYNITHPDRKLETRNSWLGYQLKMSDSETWANIVGIDTTNSLYTNSDTSKSPNGMWIASPNGYSPDGLVIADDGRVGDCASFYNEGALRPVVCLKSDVELVKQADGIYKIAESSGEAGIGINQESLRYVWRKLEDGRPTVDEITETLVNNNETTIILDEQTSKTILVQRPISKDTDSGNDWVLWIYAEDTLGNSKIIRSGEFWLDNTAPEISFNPDGDTTTWRREDTTEVTVEDKEETAPETGGSGVKTSTIKYRWVQGDTELTTENFANGEEKPYTTTDDVVKTITETISSTGGEGETLKTGDNWYLWIYAEDNAGNANVAKTANPFKLDNTRPTISVSKESAEVCKSVDITITAIDIGSGFENNSDQFIAYLSESNSDLVNEAEIKYTSGATIEDVGAGMTGWRYLFVRTVKDKVDLESEQGGNIVTASDGNKYHVYGPYIFDNTAPAVEFEPNGNETWQKEQGVTVTIRENASGKSAETETNGKVSPSDYGGYVSNYTPANGINVGWRIFHADEENIYLIADDYIAYQYVPTGKNGTAAIQGDTQYAVTIYECRK